MPDAPTGFGDFNRSIVEDLRAHGGKSTTGPFVNSDLLVLHTVGSKSGEERIAPVVYSCDRDHLVIVASKGGAPQHPSWYVNLKANPVATVEMGGEKFKVRASVVADRAERDRLYAAHAKRYPGFLDYARKTDRVIPVVLLDRIP